MSESASLTVERLHFDLSVPDSLASPVCGGRRFKRHFSKTDYPMLGESDAQERGEDVDRIWVSRRSRDLVPKALSVSVVEVRSWFRDPDTGKWRWPVNGADLVYPGIYLGDA